MKDFEKKIVLITGAGSGMGQALALKLNLLGSKLILVDVNEKGLNETVEKSGQKDNCFIYLMDVSKKENWENIHKDLKEKNLIPDIVINNAGRAMSDVSIKDVIMEDFEKIFNTNFWSVFFGTKEFLNDLLEKKTETAIINFSSIFGVLASGWASAYSTSKFAVRGFTDVLRQELRGTNVFVACVYPGRVKTGVARNCVRAQNSKVTEEEIQNICNEMDATSIVTSEVAADIIYEGMLNNNPRIVFGDDAKYMDELARIEPVDYDNFVWDVLLVGKEL